ncbi:hypothetical protein N7499_008146 [Penicillium canescens]|uniref:Uncharacterized protein n=1 Tax=Penicillium canescens TaxID=5083 RepID=A0AAD6N1V7_PENCN|nr:uncharacterized protein N7446_013179 [Penicillium canescens]KAJ6022827.1 hypothetical protein N7460_013222 [Penicillium canescens]KAJ6025909.1 hypothetical protein N7444_013588 [Penicillium canescens]KAJ6042113.1 hypothetical protein N7446_013179 [Penicillium canescens]KAJ6076165.1 hypothetical protein N7499_008146 [Penicillium canescens]KAJ6158476.1 hypothetical protein N7485_011302 [Penicillium canescens]
MSEVVHADFLCLLAGDATIDHPKTRSRSNSQSSLGVAQDVSDNQATRQTISTNPNKRKRQDSNDGSEYLSSDGSLSPNMNATGTEHIQTVETMYTRPSTTQSNEVSTFRELWVNLADAEHPPYDWDMHVSMGNMEKLRLDWSQNEVATGVIENSLSSAEINSLKDALKKLSPKVQAILRNIKSEEDSSAVRGAISYVEGLGEIEPKINAMENGPVKEAYANLYSHFESFGTPKADTTDITRYETPRPPFGINEVRLQLLRSFQQEGARVSQEADSRGQSCQAEVEEERIGQKEVDKQLRRELDSESPKIISRRRPVSNAGHKVESKE